MEQQRHKTNTSNQMSNIDTPAALNFNLDQTQSNLKDYFIQTDEQFIEDVKGIRDKKISTMKSFLQESQISDEQCQQISEYARIHSEANIFNNNSILSYKAIKKNPLIQCCSCGCKRGTGEALPLLTNEQKFTFLGPGVILLFFFLRYTKIAVIFMLASFGFISILSNILSPSEIQFIGCEQKSNELEKAICYLNLITSFGLKKSTLMRNLQLWIGFVTAIFWFFGIKLIQFLGKRKNQEIDDLLDSASDYTIRIQNLPFGEVNENELITYLQRLWKFRKDQCDQQGLESNQQNMSIGDQLNLKSIQVIYNMSYCRETLSKIQKLSLQICDLLDNKNCVYNQNISVYHQKKANFLENFQEIQNFRQNFKNDSQFRKNLSTTCALVYFHSSDQQSQFVRYFQKKNKLNPLTSICQNQKVYKYNNQQIVFTRAPEPSDFYWPNCQIKFSYFRYLIIWIITIIILYAAYAFVSYIQTIQQVKNSAQILISAIIQIFNRIIWYSLSFLVIFQYHNTKTDQIVSLMKKSIFAQVINVIVAPMIGKFINDKPLYGSNSVSLNALFYQFVMFFMMVIFYVINPLYYMKLIIKNIKYFRNKMIKNYCQVVGQIDTIDEIRPVFSFYEGPPFPIAGAYVYMATAIIHTLFYCHLQPIILLVLIGNMTGFYIIMKYLLFRRCRIPELTDVQIFEIGIGAISYGTFFYSAGSLLFIILQKYDDNKMNQLSSIELLPSSISLFLWILLNTNPFQITDKIIQGLYKIFRFQSYFQKTYNQTLSKQNTMNIISHLVSEALERNDQSDPILCQRKQSYYKNSNAHKLFNFQSQIREIANQESVKRTYELQNFCQSFCRKQSIKLQRIGDQSFANANNQDVNRYSHIEEQLAEMILIPAIQLKQTKKFKNSEKAIQQNIINKRPLSKKTNYLMNSLFMKLSKENEEINIENGNRQNIITQIQDKNEVKMQDNNDID